MTSGVKDWPKFMPGTVPAMMAGNEAEVIVNPDAIKLGPFPEWRQSG